MTDNCELIFLAEAKMKMDKSKSLEENIKIAFQEVTNHWLMSQYNDEKKEFHLNLEDKIIQGCLITHQGDVVNAAIKK